MTLHHSGLLRFGYIGTLSENKGVGWLIEQFQALSINATLEIAGRGKLDYEAKLNELADPSKVRFVGYQPSERFMQGSMYWSYRQSGLSLSGWWRSRPAHSICPSSLRTWAACRRSSGTT